MREDTLMPSPAAPTSDTVSFLKRLEDKERRTVDHLGRLTRLHAILRGELRRLRCGEDAGIVAARLTRWGIRL
jgi:hypothetical protein